MGYLEYLPPGHGDGEPRPLLVFLHGAGEAGVGSEETLRLVAELGIPQMVEAGQWPEDRPFVVLAPQIATIKADHRCDIAEELAGFLDFAVQHYAVDPAHVYLTGISCGAIGVWDYLATHGEDGVVAAAVPISGHAEWALEKAAPCDLARLAVWSFHGAVDEIVPLRYVERQMDQIRACAAADPADMKLTVYPDADHLGPIDRTYDLSSGNDIYAWMLEHTSEPSQ
jgi:predicted peptidase